MKFRTPLAALISLLLTSSSFAQTVGVVVPLSGGVPAPIVPAAPVLGGGLSMPLPSLLALTPTRAFPALVPAPVAEVAPFRVAETLHATLSAAAAEGRDQVPVLAAAFDGLKAAVLPEAVAAPAAPTPEAFALEAQRRFTALRLSEAERVSRPEGAIPSDEDMQGRLDRLPSTNPEREKFVIDLFKLGGAKDADVVLQDAGRGRHNIMVVKKGRTDRVIVVGGHHDKVRAGEGKIDNGTGATMVANLYQALHDLDTDATIVFIAFAREEEGLLGSQAYVRSLSKEQRGKIDAMINLDTLAVNGTFSWKNNSTRAVLDRLAQVARASGHALKEDYLNGGDADSSTFRDAGIPAVTVYGASQDVIFDIIHSERDNMSAFDLAHYKNAYLLVLEAIKSLDRAPLGPVGRRDI